MTALVTLLVGILAGTGGVVVGARLARRELVQVFVNIQNAARRANVAASEVESADLPAVLEHVDRLHATVQNTLQKAARAQEIAAQAALREAELEAAIASGLNVQIRKD